MPAPWENGRMLLVDHFAPTLPDALEGRFTTRLPIASDVAPVAALLTAAMHRFDPEGPARSVHLRDWPEAAALPADPDLVRTMDEVRDVFAGR